MILSRVTSISFSRDFGWFERSGAAPKMHFFYVPF